MYFNIIGAGRLGMSLASALINQSQWRLLAMCNHHLTSAQDKTKYLQEGYAVASTDELPHAPITFITTPDDQLVNIVEALANNVSLMAGDMVVHCSGVYSSTLLLPLKERGCLVASVHPLRAFASTVPLDQPFLDCDYAIEGDLAVVLLLSTVFGQWGAKMISLCAEKKQAYHAAAAMASNYIVTLASCATSLFMDAGIDALRAKELCEKLMSGSLQNMKGSADMAQALTGPLMRGDINTILLHLNAIKTPLTEGLYRAAGLATLPLTNNSDDRLTVLKSLLKQSVVDIEPILCGNDN
jgi:predicted short-subunit dehydrogenase-like oxidoreductase (DUF2520 family)